MSRKQEGSPMFYLGIDVSLKTHRCAILDSDGEKTGKSFSIDSSKEEFLTLLKALEKIARSFQGNSFSSKKAEEIVAAAASAIYSGRAQSARGNVLIHLIRQICDLKAAIAELDDSISQALNTPTNGPSELDMITSIPGVGPKTAAVLIAEIGDISRFQSANQLVGYFGFFPFIRESGGRLLGKPRMSNRGPKHFRKAVYMASVASLKHNRHLKALYDRKVSQGKAPKQAIIVVARKLLATVYSLLRYQTYYDPLRLALPAFA